MASKILLLLCLALVATVRQMNLISIAFCTDDVILSGAIANWAQHAIKRIKTLNREMTIGILHHFNNQIVSPNIGVRLQPQVP